MAVAREGEYPHFEYSLKVFFSSLAMVYGSELHSLVYNKIETGQPHASRAPSGQHRKTVGNGQQHLVFTVFV